MGPHDDDVYEFGPFRFDIAEKLLSSMDDWHRSRHQRTFHRGRAACAY